jgi:hypothetical protein
VIVSSWSIDRGRSYELDQNSPGTAQVTLIDTTGELDPSGLAYTFNPTTPAAIALRNPVLGTDHTIFRGHLERINYDLYQTENYATVTLDLVDGLDRLANMEMYAGVGHILTWGDAAFVSTAQDGDVWFDVDDTGNAVATRINKILDSAQWPGGLREIFSGNVGLQSTVYSYRTSAMTAIQDAADAEFPGVANVYVQGNGANAGKLTFHGRLARFNPADAQYHIAIWRCGDMAAVAADSTRALIFELEYDRDAEKVINSAMSTPQNIADADVEAQRVEDAASIAAYGSRSISFDNLLTNSGFTTGNDANQETKLYGQYYVDNYATPRTRVNKITFKRVGPQDPYAAALWRLMCNVEISDIIRLKTTHHGGAGGFDEDFYVEGIHYNANPLSDQYVDVELSLDVSPRAYYDTDPF